MTAALGILRAVPLWAWALTAALLWGGFQHNRATRAGQAAIKAQKELADVRADAAQATVTALNRAIAGQTEAIRDAQAQTAAAESGRAAAAASLAGLLDRYRTADRVRAAPAAAGASAPGAGPELCPNLLRSVGEAAGQFAAAADRARIAGQACESAYDATRAVKP